MVIQRGDRVAAVLERDARFVEVFASVSPHFERLRRPSLRRVMARLVTVEQAARIAGVNPEVLLERLNQSLSTWSAPDGPVLQSASLENAVQPAPPEPVRQECAGTGQPRAVPIEGEQIPGVLAGIPPGRVVDLDVREELRQGREPFSRIMSAKAELPHGHVLRLRAIFEPAPLYTVMAKQGFQRWTEKLAADDWRVWFYRADEAGQTEIRPTLVDPDDAGEARLPDEAVEDVIVLDVRGMEPPEPMVRTLAALEALPPGGTLVQLNARVPEFLLPKLDELGFRYEVREQDEDLVRVFIRRGEDR
jgi:uncharacterized protein (DUF2249 family)